MKRTLLMSIVLMLTLFQAVLAQTRAVSGRVTDQKTGEGLPGVTVLLKGTTNGASTNSDGAFSLTIPEGNGTLVFSSIGYVPQERIIGKETQFSVALGADVKQLNEVVVTALGIEKDTRSLGYATQQINSDQLSQKSEPNALSALQGKVSGVTIQTASGLPGASTNINIRGITSFSGSNQPLFVVDGIPISNTVDVAASGGYGSLGAPQTSNRALDIDPENIASISILKGPAAAALYGSRAASGAVLITTKGGHGAANKKLEVTVTSGLTFQNVYGLAKLQNDYGQGTSGRNIQTVAGNPNFGSTASFGPRYGTTPTLFNGLLAGSAAGLALDANGNPIAIDYQPYDNIKNFYQRGRILTNGVNIQGGNAEQNVSLNINNTDQKGITQNSHLKRTSVQLGANATLLNKLRIGGSVNFIQTNQTGPQQGNGGSAFASLSTLPRSYNLQGLPYVDANGRNIFIGTTATAAGTENPYFSVNQNTFESNLTRFINVASLAYDVTPWFNVTYRAGYDVYTDRRKSVFAISSTRQPNGQVQDASVFRGELNGDLLLNFKKDNLFLGGLNANLLLGQNINQRRNQTIVSQADQLIFNGFPSSTTGIVFSNGTGETSSTRRLLGVYGQLSLAYKDYLFLELTGRADKSSTLPVGNNTYFYPSVTAGFVFSDALKIQSNVFSYGKIRANYAKVGRDANAYALDTYYNVGSYGNNVANVNFPLTATPNGSTSPVTYAGYGLSNVAGGGQTLQPEFTRSYEVGTNLGFFNNRVTFDLTYFKTISENQIFQVTTPGSTGLAARVTNVGRLDNKGYEALVNINPVRGAFKWDITGNFTRIRNKVVSIAPGVTQSSINTDAFTGFVPSIVEGLPYGVILGSAVTPRVTDTTSPYYGQYIVNPATGAFASSTGTAVIADPNFSWQAGLTNSFTYKGVGLSFLFDTNQGGGIFSYTNYVEKIRGMLKETAVNDRNLPRQLPGVIQTGTGADGKPIYAPNNIQIDAQTYWGALANGSGSENNVYDATVYRLREVTLSYSLPKALLERTPFGGASISLTGRNLFFYAPNANFDPDVSTQGAANGAGANASTVRGLEIQGAPNTRNYGVNLRFTL
ncbi:SusC/RagA family TonB-linked outer membrane protein [Hymenobacter sp. HMF4947]|uniref:SusC/RagA family TonB-linked outer membrane protein n=1 Tax=Hymenobacter ginkgonis TaxID=2682976 RepID=A0A7K1TIH7_9BACT|nr:SusC/RagA family TonB-linked outer membrane protein [Hymenobacter ginkgonis]MVN78208.1 SusC/RagA family TonB-linked outer membrane protein [Hymenobacter ginkgonis]